MTDKQFQEAFQIIIGKLDEIILQQNAMIETLKIPMRSYDKDEMETNDAMERPEIYN